jgi:hypothetical protein
VAPFGKVLEKSEGCAMGKDMYFASENHGKLMEEWCGEKGKCICEVLKMSRTMEN